MTETTGRTVVHWDLARAIPSRPDEDELVQDCIAFLDERRTGEFPVPRLDRVSGGRAQAEIAAAKLRTGLQSQAPEIAALKRKLEQADATISRLLAFVPTRAEAVGPDRLEFLAESLSTEAERLFPTSRRVTVLVGPETDADVEAIHRVTIGVDAGKIGPETAASGVAGLHAAFARLATVPERRAVELVVDAPPAG